MDRSDYVDVRDEPRHRLRFENAYARVYDVLVPPGDTTLYHRHTEDTFYVATGRAELRDQTWGDEDSRLIALPMGLSLCRPHRSEPLIHRVGNVGDSDMRMIGAEAKKSPPHVAEKALEAPAHALLWEAERLRAYDLNLDPQQSTGAIEYPFSGLTVFLGSSCVEVGDQGGSRRVLGCSPGDLVWHDGPISLSITNVGVGPCRAVVCEWR